MKRHIPGLHGESNAPENILEGVFLVRVDRVSTAGIPSDRSTSCGSSFSNQRASGSFP